MVTTGTRVTEHHLDLTAVDYLPHMEIDARRHKMAARALRETVTRLSSRAHSRDRVDTGSTSPERGLCRTEENHHMVEIHPTCLSHGRDVMNTTSKIIK